MTNASMAVTYRDAAMSHDAEYIEARRRLRKAMASADSNGIAVQVLQHEVYTFDRDRQFCALMAVYCETAAMREAHAEK